MKRLLAILVMWMILLSTLSIAQDNEYYKELTQKEIKSIKAQLENDPVSVEDWSVIDPKDYALVPPKEWKNIDLKHYEDISWVNVQDAEAWNFIDIDKIIDNRAQAEIPEIGWLQGDNLNKISFGNNLPNAVEAFKKKFPDVDVKFSVKGTLYIKDGKLYSGELLRVKAAFPKEPETFEVAIKSRIDPKEWPEEKYNIEVTENGFLIKEKKDGLNSYQKQMKEHKHDHKKVIELQKPMMEVQMKYMMHSFRPLLFTFLPLILIFNWLRAVFQGIDLNFLWFMHNWIWVYILTSIIFSMIIRKLLKVH